VLLRFDAFDALLDQRLAQVYYDLRGELVTAQLERKRAVVALSAGRGDQAAADDAALRHDVAIRAMCDFLRSRNLQVWRLRALPFKECAADSIALQRRR
jgi:hypothetical protein